MTSGEACIYQRGGNTPPSAGKETRGVLTVGHRGKPWIRRCEVAVNFIEQRSPCSGCLAGSSQLESLGNVICDESLEG